MQVATQSDILFVEYSPGLIQSPTMFVRVLSSRSTHSVILLSVAAAGCDKKGNVKTSNHLQSLNV